jgi:amino acid transporter
MSLTFLIGSIVLKPYIALEPKERDFIVILTVLNMSFSIYYIIEALRLEKVFKLEDKHVFKFGKRIGIVSLVYSPLYLIFFSLLFLDLHELQVMIVYLNLIINTMLLGVVFKEVYDLLFITEAERKFELEKNRKLYLEP